MNPNDILQQQQAMLDQMMNRSNQFIFIIIIVQLIGAAISAWVLYMFYRCQRDTADELRKIRVAYQLEIDRRFQSSLPPAAVQTSEEKPFSPLSGDNKYRPKQ